MSINMVEPELLGKIGKITIINVGEATKVNSEELQVAFSEVGLNLLTNEGVTTSAEPMDTSSLPGIRTNELKILEIVQLDTLKRKGRGIVAVQALINTGAEVSCINQRMAEKLEIDPQATLRNVRVTGARGITSAVLT